MSTAELATSYAALILADDGVDITVSELPTTSLRTTPAGWLIHGLERALVITNLAASIIPNKNLYSAIANNVDCRPISFRP